MVVPPGERHDGGGLADARRAGDDDVGHIALPGEHGEPGHRLLVPHDLGEGARPELLDPRHVPRLGLLCLTTHPRQGRGSETELFNRLFWRQTSQGAVAAAPPARRSADIS